MTEFIKRRIFEMLLSGDLLFRYGFFILEEDNHSIESEDVFPDAYHLVGLKNNTDEIHLKNKDFSPWIYETAYTIDYTSTDWQTPLVNRFKEFVTGKDWDYIVHLAYEYSCRSKNYINRTNRYGTTAESSNPFACKIQSE